MSGDDFEDADDSDDFDDLDDTDDFDGVDDSDDTDEFDDLDDTDEDFDPGRALHEHLQATEELPVEREAGWRIGEAQALAADIASGELDHAVVRDRAAEIHELLAAVDRTGDSEADDRVEAARELARRLADR